jgi:hypothetical protein
MLHTVGKRRDRNKEEDIRQAITQRSRKSLSRLSAEQNTPNTTCHRMFSRHLNVRPYRVQRMHALTQLNYEARLNFVTIVCEWHQGDDQWLKRWMFTDEATFHVCGRINKHNCLIWGIENPHDSYELERVSHKEIA